MPRQGHPVRVEKPTQVNACIWLLEGGGASVSCLPFLSPGTLWEVMYERRMENERTGRSKTRKPTRKGAPAGMQDRAQDRIREIVRRELLKARARNPHVSLRAFARKLRLAPSALSEILGAERRVTAKMAERILYGLGVQQDEAVPLIKACQSGAQQRRGDKVKGEGPVPVRAWDEFDVLDSHAFELIAEWHHFAIVSLLETQGAKDDPTWISQRLSISEKEVRHSLDVLEKLGMLKRTGGRLRPSGNLFKTRSEVADDAIRFSHFQNLDLARRSLENDAVDVRHFSALTVAVNLDKLEEVRKRIFAFHGEIMDLVETDPTREVYRLVVQWFPLTKGLPK